MGGGDIFATYHLAESQIIVNMVCVMNIDEVCDMPVSTSCRFPSQFCILSAYSIKAVWLRLWALWLLPLLSEKDANHN